MRSSPRAPFDLSFPFKVLPSFLALPAPAGSSTRSRREPAPRPRRPFAAPDRPSSSAKCTQLVRTPYLHARARRADRGAGRCRPASQPASPEDGAGSSSLRPRPPFGDCGGAYRVRGLPARFVSVLCALLVEGGGRERGRARRLGPRPSRVVYLMGLLSVATSATREPIMMIDDNPGFGSAVMPGVGSGVGSGVVSVGRCDSDVVSGFLSVASCQASAAAPTRHQPASGCGLGVCTTCHRRRRRR